MTTVKVFALAKINLALHVTGRRADGYHEIDSLVVFARDVGDNVTATLAPTLSIAVTGPLSAGVPDDESNLGFRAARLMQDLRGIDNGAQLTVEKHLPSGGGIGGGSSDAAATIAALSQLWKVPPLSSEEALALGADVPVCLLSQSCRVQGIGEKLTPCELPPVFAVLANPQVPVSTAAVFAALDHAENPPMPDEIPEFSDASGLIQWLAACRNDLESPARKLVPGIANVLEALGALHGAGLARMSGSGATCFALFADMGDAQAAEARLQSAHPNWWVRATPVAN